MANKFNHLNVPDQWNHYWSRYPQGYTIMESLIAWVSQVDAMVDNQNGLALTVEDFDKTIEDFLGQYDTGLRTTVEATLQDWRKNGIWDNVINAILQTKIDQIGASIIDMKTDIAQAATKAELSGIATPLVATTAAQMTNTGRIYVYKGAEGGYTNGSWYYHNGAAWVVGGTYQASTTADNSILTRHLGTDAVTLDKVSFLDGVSTTPTPTRLRYTNIFLNEITQQWAFHFTNSAIVTSYTIPLEPNQNISIQVVGSDNTRFRAAVTNTNLHGLDVYGDRLPDRVITTDDTTKSLEFTNTADGKLLLVYLGLGEVNTTLSVTSNVSIRSVLPLDAIESDYELELTAITDTTADTLTSDQEIYPTLCAVKVTNKRPAEQPHPIGWLYRTNEVPERFMYASGKPDNMRELTTWRTEISYLNQGAWAYSQFVTPDGDLLNICKGELVGTELPVNPAARQNPIVYPAGDYSNPVVVDVGSVNGGIKPTSWLQNSGAVYNYEDDYFMFAEYTRPVHAKCYVWKVTKPFTDPNNWKVVKEFPLSGSNNIGFKHAHCVDIDPFTGYTYLATGDDSSAAAIYLSRDNGATWEVELSESEATCRLLNLIFTKDSVYWATDSGKPGLHFFFRVDRDGNGLPDFGTITTLYQFPDSSFQQATYASVFLRDPSGILFLDRFDVPSNFPMPVYFWSFETNKMHTVGEIEPVGGQNLTYGFRGEALNWYQPIADDRIVFGFGAFQNDISGLGNTVGASSPGKVNNLSIRLKKTKKNRGM